MHSTETEKTKLTKEQARELKLTGCVVTKDGRIIRTLSFMKGNALAQGGKR